MTSMSTKSETSTESSTTTYGDRLCAICKKALSEKMHLWLESLHLEARAMNGDTSVHVSIDSFRRACGDITEDEAKTYCGP